MEIIKKEGLATWNLGKLEGTPQTKEAQSAVDQQLINKPDTKVSTGESFTEFYTRVRDTITDIINKSPDNTVVVTHNSVFGLIKVWDKAGRPKHFYRELRTTYTKQDSNTGDYYTIKGKNGTIYICRHGETEDNKAGNFRSNETELTDKGKEQAEELGEVLSKVKINEIISSPIERAVETARLILESQDAKKPKKVEAAEVEEEKEEEEESKGLKKSDFLYMEPGPKDDKKTFASCGSCKMFLAKHNLCSLHGKDVEIDADDSCGLWVRGGPAKESEMEHVTAAVTPEESGLTEGPVQCQNCHYFMAEEDHNDCLLFRMLGIKDYHVPAEACCNAFSKKK